MTFADIIAAGGALGVPGMLIAYIVWTDTNNRKDRREHHERNMAVQKDAIDANMKIATALEALKIIITGGRNV
jgi:hypothetical protein